MNPCRQRGFSAPPKRFMYRLHKRGISTFFTPLFFLHVFLSFFFKRKISFFLFFVLQAQNGYSGTRNASAEAGRSAPPRFNILRSKEKTLKKMKSKQKPTKQKNHLG